MKVLLVNGSPKPKGCTYTALNEVAKALNDDGIETEILHIGAAAVLDCCDCRTCKRPNVDGTRRNRCVFFDDCVNTILEKMESCDGFVVGSPVYYGHTDGRILCILNRVFFAGNAIFANKPGAAVVSARRAGTTATLDVLNKYFSISSMPQVGSTYWNMVHGNTPEEVLQDKEGLQTMRNLGHNMAWLIKCIDAGKKAGIKEPERIKEESTNFIR